MATIKNHKVEKLESYGNANKQVSAAGYRINVQASTILAICFIATLVLPSVSCLGRGLRSTLPIFIIWLLLFPMENRVSVSFLLSVFKKRRFELSMLIVWFLVVLLNAVLGRGYTGWTHVIFTVMLGMIIFMQTVYAALKPKAFKSIVFWTIILLGIETARSLPMLFSHPGIAKDIMGVVNASDIYDAYINGVGEYNFYTANAIVYPFFIAAAFKFKGVKRIIYSASCVFIGVAVLLSTFTGAVSIMVFGLLTLAILSYGKSLKKFLTGVANIGLVLIIFLPLFLFLIDTEQVNEVISKIVRLYEGISGQGLLEGEETGRAYLFTISLNSFLSNPFLGVGPCTTVANPNLYIYVGGHSSWIDQLAEYGIIGFSFFIAFAMAIAQRIRVYFFRYKNNLIITASFISVLLYFIGGIVNPVVFIPSMMVLFFLLMLGSVDIEVHHGS